MTEQAAAEFSAVNHRPNAAILRSLQAGRAAEELPYLKRRILAAPEDSNASYLFALASAAIGDGETERAWMGHARVLAPRNAQIQTSLGMARLRDRDVEGAHEAFSKAIEYSPNYAAARYQRSILDLEVMRWEQGWTDYEWRFTYPAAPGVWRDFPSPVWDGRSEIDGKLLVWAEQSTSAQIFFCSVLDEINLPGRLVVEVDPGLATLFQRSFPDAEIVIAETQPNPRFSEGDIAAQIPMGRLCGMNRRSILDFRKGKPRFLSADPDLAVDIMLDIAKPEKRTIGLAWRSQSRNGPELTLQRLTPLLTLPDITWVSLEGREARAEVEAFEQATGIRLATHPDVDEATDYDGLAALVAACDLIITPDKPVAHIAGGMGRSVWTLLPERFSARWYWFSGHRTRPPKFARWYPSMRLLWRGDAEAMDDYIARTADLVTRARQPTPE